MVRLDYLWSSLLVGIILWFNESVILKLATKEIIVLRKFFLQNKSTGREQHY